MFPRLLHRAAFALGVVWLVLPGARGRAQGVERLTNWTHPVFPVAEYTARCAAILANIGENDVLLVPSAEGTSGGETFRQLDDFEYLVGVEVARSVLAIDGRSRRSMLFVPRTDARFENVGRPNDFPGRVLLADPSLRALSGVDTVLLDEALETFLFNANTRGARVLINPGRPGALREVPSNAFVAPSPGDLLLAHLQRTHAEVTLGNAFALIAARRMVKSPREIAALRESARVTSVAIARGAARVQPGLDERTATGTLSANCRTLGAQRDAFSPIIKSGVNSLWPWRILGAQYDRRNRAMQAGELVIFDVGCERDHYVSDVGRTFPVNGQFTSRQRELVEMVRQISDAVIAAAKPGMTFASLQAVAVAAIPPSARPYMQAPLYFGHHIGLDVSDPTIATATLAPGMVFTIEPWYYNHAESVAVFIEDEILITASGSENLTADLPRNAAGLELLRSGRDTLRMAHDAGRLITRDGILAFTLDAAAGAVRIFDMLNGLEATTTSVCAHPRRAALTVDDVSLLVECDGAPSPIVVNTASYEVVAPIAPVVSRNAPAARGATAKAPVRKNEVVVIGMIHGEHRTSARYSTGVLRQLLQALKPDYVLTEISPNRFDAAMRQFTHTGQITEPRVLRFPEYIDVLFPLSTSMAFTIVPTAGWSKPMDAYRTAALKRIEADPSRRAEWQEYTSATRRADSLTALHGADNPFFINSAAYDSLQTAAHEPYNRLFNSELGPGGWDNINWAHYGNIARTLDAHRGEGKRLVITYGAGHKEWFMRELAKRDDIVILEVAPFLRQIGAK